MKPPGPAHACGIMLVLLSLLAVLQTTRAQKGAPAAKVTFELVYEELLKRRLGVYELLLKVQPQQLVKHLQMDIHIFEPQGISFLETESTFMTNELADALTVSQNQTKVGLPQWVVGRVPRGLSSGCPVSLDPQRVGQLGRLSQLIENGYFVHYFAPEGLSKIPKNVIFVIDTSGSMMGKKIQQVGTTGQGRALKTLRCDRKTKMAVSHGSAGKRQARCGRQALTADAWLGPSFQPTENITFQMESQVAKQEEEFQKPKYIFHGFMERLWAYLTIHQLLERMVSASDAEKQALETQALGLSLNYSFVTPLTSMVVTKPEGQEQSQVAEKPVENGRTVFRHRAMGHPLSKGAAGVSPYVRLHKVAEMSIGPPGFPVPSNYLFPFSKSDLDPRLPSETGEPLSDLEASLPQGEGKPASFPFLANPILESFSFSTPLVFDYLDETMEDVLPASRTASAAPAPIQASTFILPLPGQSGDQLCVDIKSTRGPLLLLLSDPDQGLEVIGEYDMEKAQFSVIEVTFNNLQLQVQVSPEQVVVTRDRRSSQYKWKETLFMVMPG
ncbi:PREDICTED: inter-alpha-trypsin inhibitor heavy chain H4 [Myotis davidii]|uniref:inter-alpha-trypsin inhibitor heavy chain H4 n=1 Tax=Myotis davidii TaxID=225400 RepID=UPI000766F0A3|nr:PREDICTED: inter-alpha-trypsin inhibitor heavy chain H4 [Myotis davidii]